MTKLVPRPFRWLLAALVSACSGGALAQQLTYLTHWPPETVALLEKAIDRYEAENPGVTIQVRAVPFGNLLSTLRSQAASASGPTIAGIYELWLPELVANGVAAPIPDELAADVTDGWPAGLVSSVSVGDTIYGYPNEVNLYALNYNRRLFEEAGLPGPPTTWDELEEYAAKLTVKQGNVTVRQGFGIITNWDSGVVHPWLSLVYSNGGALIRDGQAVLDEPAALEAARLYERLIAAGSTDPSMATANASTTGPYLQHFANGETAMIIMANWWQSALRDSMGDAFEDIATAPIPVGPERRRPAPRLLRLADDRQRERLRRGAGRGLGLPRLAERAGERPGRLERDGRHPDVDGHPAEPQQRRGGPPGRAVDAVPRGLHLAARQRDPLPDADRRRRGHRRRAAGAGGDGGRAAHRRAGDGAGGPRGTVDPRPLT